MEAGRFEFFSPAGIGFDWRLRDARGRPVARAPQALATFLDALNDVQGLRQEARLVVLQDPQGWTWSALDSGGDLVAVAPSTFDGEAECRRAARRALQLAVQAHVDHVVRFVRPDLQS